MPQIPDWLLVDEDGSKRLRRSYTFKDFQSAMTFSQAVGDEAEAAGHHSILTTEWGNVTVEWWTHDIGGLIKMISSWQRKRMQWRRSWLCTLVEVYQNVIEFFCQV